MNTRPTSFSRAFQRRTISIVDYSRVQRRLVGLSSVVPYPSLIIVASNVVTKNSRSTSFNIHLESQ